MFAKTKLMLSRRLGDNQWQNLTWLNACGSNKLLTHVLWYPAFKGMCIFAALCIFLNTLFFVSRKLEDMYHKKSIISYGTPLNIIRCTFWQLWWDILYSTFQNVLDLLSSSFVKALPFTLFLAKLFFFYTFEYTIDIISP